MILPNAALFSLRAYWKTHRNPRLLFPAGKAQEERHSALVHMDRGGVKKSFKAIVKSCNIKKDVSIHSLRHYYGTDLTGDGLNLRALNQYRARSTNKDMLYF